jgi:hypothetical protein
MSGTEDIVTRLRVLLFKCCIAPVMGVWSRDLRDAADEIERLRAERDEARRECCRHMAHGVMSAEDYAKYLNWDCFKGDK